MWWCPVWVRSFVEGFVCGLGGVQRWAMVVGRGLARSEFYERAGAGAVVLSGVVWLPGAGVAWAGASGGVRERGRGPGHPRRRKRRAVRSPLGGARAGGRWRVWCGLGGVVWGVGSCRVGGVFPVPCDCFVMCGSVLSGGGRWGRLSCSAVLVLGAGVRGCE